MYSILEHYLSTNHILMIGMIVTFILTFFLLEHPFSFLPSDQGRAFAVNGSLSKGKLRGVGFIFVLCFLISSVLFLPIDVEYVIYAILLFAMMISGYLDDASKTPWNEYKKGLIDLVISVVAVVTYMNFNSTTICFGADEIVIPKALFLILGVILIWVSVNVTNCTDGVDGLCASLCSVTLLAFGVLFAPILQKYAMANFLFLSVLFAYLYFNSSPSSMLMGDAGSRALGFYIAVIALKSTHPFIYILLAAVMIVGGGIGTRGPGEKKLEMDRRLIRERISRLKKELADVERHRELLRSQRNQSGMKVAALVGYTSAGKSSIENALTNAGILEDAMLFSTLDTTTRALQLDGTQEILLTDTVGFIRKLPHHLIEAFKSTLEEAKYADIIIHVVDVSNPRMDEQMYVVYDTLRQMGAEGKPVITLFNKQDRLEKEESHKDFQADYSIATSAKTGQGLDKLKAALLEIIRRDQIYVERLYPFADAGKIQMIRSKGQLLSEEYLPEGIQIKAYVPQDVYGKL